MGFGFQRRWGFRCLRLSGSVAPGPGSGPRSGGAGQLQTCAGGFERGPVSPTPLSHGCPFPLVRGCLFTSCSAATRYSAPPDPASRPELRVHTPSWRRVELGAGWIGPLPPSSGPKSSPLLPAASRPLGAPFQLGCSCGESRTFWPTFGVENAGGACRQAAVISVL